MGMKLNNSFGFKTNVFFYNNFNNLALKKNKMYGIKHIIKKR